MRKLVQPHIQKYFPFHKPELEGVSPVKAAFSGKVVQAPFDLALGKIVPFGQKISASRDDIVKVKVHKLCLNRFLLKVANFVLFNDNLVFLSNAHILGSQARS